MALLTAGFPATAGPLVTLGPITPELIGIALLSNDFAQDVKLRTTGKTIGDAGELFFGVGPAIKGGDPDGVTVNDYFPTHAASGSFM